MLSYTASVTSWCVVNYANMWIVRWEQNFYSKALLAWKTRLRLSVWSLSSWFKKKKNTARPLSNLGPLGCKADVLPAMPCLLVVLYEQSLGNDASTARVAVDTAASPYVQRCLLAYVWKKYERWTEIIVLNVRRRHLSRQTHDHTRHISTWEINWKGTPSICRNICALAHTHMFTHGTCSRSNGIATPKYLNSNWPNNGLAMPNLMQENELLHDIKWSAQPNYLSFSCIFKHGHAYKTRKYNG